MYLFTFSLQSTSLGPNVVCPSVCSFVRENIENDHNEMMKLATQAINCMVYFINKHMLQIKRPSWHWTPRSSRRGAGGRTRVRTARLWCGGSPRTGPALGRGSRSGWWGSYPATQVWTPAEGWLTRVIRVKVSTNFRGNNCNIQRKREGEKIEEEEEEEDLNLQVV